MALGTVNGVNYNNALVAKPPVMVHQGEYGGNEKIMMDTYTLTGDAADGDIVKLGLLPPGAKVLSARIFGADLGGSGTLKLGNGAGSDAADTAVDNSFITAADSSGQAWDVGDGATAAMRGAAIATQRFNSAVDLLLKFVGATSGATGVKITSVVKYIVD